MLRTKLDQARSAIASEIGPDVAEFTPPGEKHFVAEAALMEMAGTFLFAFFKGVVTKASEVAQQKVGDHLGTAIGDAAGSLLNRLRHKEATVSDTELQVSQADATAALRTHNLSQEDITAIANAVAAAMTAALSKRSDAEISSRVVERVKQESLKMISETS